jgi:hypothetical protein
MACTPENIHFEKNIKPSGRIFKLTHCPFPELAQNGVPLC